MVRIRQIASHLGTGIGLVYLFFMWEPIYTLFPEAFLILIRQVLSLSFAVCILLAPEQIVRAGQKMAPKVVALIAMFFNINIKNKDNDA